MAVKTQYWKVAPHTGADDPSIREAAAILRRGGLVAFPTETVYGLGGNALESATLAAIFTAKRRPRWDPIIVHVSSIAMAQELVMEWPAEVDRLAQAFMPGPLTLLLDKRPVVPDACTAGSTKVGIRFPSHPVARALIEAAGRPIAAPSANLFGGTSPTTAQHVLADLDGVIDGVLDAGPCSVGVESTVMDPCAKPPVIFRPGGISREQIEAALGMPVRLHVRKEETKEEDAPLSAESGSPGLSLRHYAPRALLRLVYGEEDLTDIADNTLDRGLSLGIMRPTDWRLPGHISRRAVLYEWGAIGDTETLARRLYNGLHWLDSKKVAVILCPVPKDKGIGLAIHDRLIRAATEKK